VDQYLLLKHSKLNKMAQVIKNQDPLEIIPKKVYNVAITDGLGTLETGTDLDFNVTDDSMWIVQCIGIEPKGTFCYVNEAASSPTKVRISCESSDIGYNGSVIVFYLGEFPK